VNPKTIICTKVKTACSLMTLMGYQMTCSRTQLWPYSLRVRVTSVVELMGKLHH
jgi:hypothetical protein